MIAQCQLWVARSYAEMGWQYEAEDMLNRVQMDALSRKHAQLYSAVKADVLLEGGHYREAIPFVNIAMPHEKRKIYRPRFAYVLGQLYELEHRRDEAIRAYKSAIRMAPPNEMEFNARIRVAELGGKSSLKQLRTMIKQAKYKDRLDRIYGAMGNIWLAEKDTAKALEMYEKAIAEATQAGSAKSEVLVRAGDIYFEQHKYVPAQPCYREAVTIITAEHNDYARVQKRSEVLDELIVSYNQAQLQDSLQRLSHMTEEEQRAVVDKIIADLIEAEKQDSINQAQEARELAHGDSGPRSVNTANMLGGSGQKGEWYFYNPQLMKQGKQEWHKRWGTRPLEDNWRRQNKQVTIPEDMSAELDEESGELAMDSLAMDSLATVQPRMETDTHKPEYYLQQIPKTEQDYALSDSLWREALVELYYIYRDKLEDGQQAQETLRFLDERWGTHPSVLAIHEDEQLRALRDDPVYIARMQRMLAEQDSLYAVTYAAYTKGQYAMVKTNKQYAQTEFPQSRLMPRFLFLNAVSVARTEGQQAFMTELQEIVANYGETELGAMAKDMLAMLGQGMESKKGGATGNLADMRGQVEETPEETETEQQWSEDRKQPSVVLLILSAADEQALNELLYEVALFNFSQFLIRDFDLQKLPVWGEGCALRVSGFADLDEAEWWIDLVQKNADMQAVLLGIEIKAVTEVNLPLLK